MADKSIGELKSKVSADVSGFSTGMEKVKRSTQENLNQFKVAASAARAFGSATDELKAKQEFLSKQIEEQRKKVELLKSAYDKSAAEKGTDAKATQALADKLATAQAALNNTQADLKKVNGALQDQEKQTKTTSSAWETFKGKLGGAGQALAKVGKAAAIGIGAVGTAVGAVGAGIGKLVLDTAEAGDNLIDLSTKTGLSTDRLQELAYVGEQVGTDVDTVTGSLSKMIRSMDMARKGTKDQVDAFDTLGVSFQDGNGNLRDSEAVMFDVLDALGKVSNETDRDALAMNLFGKSAMELNPLIAAGSDEIARLSEEAHQMGAVLGEDDVQAAADLADQMSGLKLGFQGVVSQVGAAFLPAMSQIATKGGDYLKQFAAIVKNSDGDISKMGSGIGELAGRIVQDLAAQLPGLLKAGLSILQGLVMGIVKNLPTLVGAATDVILSLVKFLLENLPMIMQSAVDIILALTEGLTAALPELIPAMVAAVGVLVEGLASNLPLLIMAAVQLIGAIVVGLISAIPELINAIPVIIKALVKAFQDNGPQMLEVGKNVVEGVWQGILSMKDKFSQDVKNFFSNIVGSVKSALGIQSPAKVMKPLGKYTVQGFTGGIQAEAKRMQAVVNASMRSLALNGALAGNSAMSESFTFYGPVVINGQQGQRMAQAAKVKRY